MKNSSLVGLMAGLALLSMGDTPVGSGISKNMLRGKNHNKYIGNSKRGEITPVLMGSKRNQICPCGCGNKAKKCDNSVKFSNKI